MLGWLLNLGFGGGTSAIVPSGPLSIAKHALRVTLADCQEFRDFVGASTQAEALDDIYLDGLPKPADNADVHTLAELQAYRPYAIVFTAENQGFKLDFDAAGVGGYEYKAAGRLGIMLNKDCPDGLGDDPSSAANVQFRDEIGEIIEDLAELAGTAPDEQYLNINTVELEHGPYWPHPKVAATEGLWQQADLSVTW